VLQGRLDCRPELEQALGTASACPPCCSNAFLVASAYRCWGDRVVDRLTGDFAFALADPRRGRLLLARDRLGLRPLCYARFGDTFAFSTEAKALLACSGESAVPDELMLADFVLYFLAADGQHRTFFRGIHALPPAHTLTATAEGVSLRRYFEFSAVPIRFKTDRDYSDTFHRLVSTSVKNRLCSAAPVAVSVSGGLDSSYIFCSALRLIRDEPGLCPAVVGINYSGAVGTPSDEREFIREIEQCYDVRIEHVAEQSGFLREARDDVWRSESPIVDGMGRLQHAVRHRVREVGARRLLTGHWGDQVLVDSDYLLDLAKSGRWRDLRRQRRAWRVGARQLMVRLARDLFERYAPSGAARAARRARAHFDGAWTRPWFTPQFKRLLRERFSAERPCAFKESTSHARAIWRQACLGYFVQCMQWNARLASGAGLDVAFPYLDVDLLHFLMSIPGEVLSLDGHPRGLMREAMRGTVPDLIRRRRSKGEFTHLFNEGILEDFELVHALFDEDARSIGFGYVDGAVVRKALSEWQTHARAAKDAIVANHVLDLCGLELILRTFFPTPAESSR